MSENASSERDINEKPRKEEERRKLRKNVRESSMDRKGDYYEK